MCLRQVPDLDVVITVGLNDAHTIILVLVFSSFDQVTQDPFASLPMGFANEIFLERTVAVHMSLDVVPRDIPNSFSRYF